MATDSERHLFRTGPFIGLLLLIAVFSGCMKAESVQTTTSSSANPCEGYGLLQQEHRAARKRLARQRIELRRTEAELNRIQLKLLEASAGHAALQKRLSARE